MIKELSRHSAASTEQTLTSKNHLPSQFDEYNGAIQLANGGGHDQSIYGHSTSDAHHTGDHLAANADHTNGHQVTSGGLLLIDGTIENTSHAVDVHSIDQPHSILASDVSFTDVPANGQDLVGENQYMIVVDNLDGVHLSGIFDNLGDFHSGLSDAATYPGFESHSGLTFESDNTGSFGHHDILSDVKGGAHSGGGGGTGGTGHGGSTPADYTTNSGTGVDFHITYDSSVANAPTGFTAVVQEVADFFANTFQDLTHITIDIAVGYGEVDGMRMPHGALGESVTNLQDVSYSTLVNDLGLTSGSSPVGDSSIYVSYAEAKALNIPITSPSSVDGYVGFSNQSGIFDYNNSDGVSSGQYDFFGVVAHEFSEVMGRILLVGATISNMPSYMAYDFFHYSAPGVQDFSGNGGYFSIDGGNTNLATFNNASNGGDAGDWASGGGGSVYDAFNAFGTSGQVMPISQVDLQALQAVGFDLLHTTTTA